MLARAKIRGNSEKNRMLVQKSKMIVARAAQEVRQGDARDWMREGVQENKVGRGTNHSCVKLCTEEKEAAGGLMAKHGGAGGRRQR